MKFQIYHCLNSVITYMPPSPTLHICGSVWGTMFWVEYIFAFTEMILIQYAISALYYYWTFILDLNFFMQWTLRGLCIGTLCAFMLCFLGVTQKCIMFLIILMFGCWCLRIYRFPWCNMDSARDNQSSNTSVHYLVHW